MVMNVLFMIYLNWNKKHQEKYNKTVDRLMENYKTTIEHYKTAIEKYKELLKIREEIFENNKSLAKISKEMIENYEKVVETYKNVCKCALADLEGVMYLIEPDGEREHPAWKTIEELREVIKL